MRTLGLTLTAVLFAATLLSGAGKDNAGTGQAIFQEQCIGCHGPDGRAQTDMGKQLQAADLTAGSIQQQSDSQLSKIVKNGKGKMPAFEGKLSGGDIRAVVAYIKELGKKH